MSGKYHAGEVAVQARAGVREGAARVANGIRDFIPPAAAEFLQTQSFVVGAVGDGDGRVWASPLRGPLRLADEQTVAVPANLRGAVGLVIMDFATRRRMRVNGIAGGGLLRVGECYANCPQYIHDHPAPPASAETTDAPLPAPPFAAGLTPAQAAQIAASDTFFIATRHGEASADASHRGGDPGFVWVVDEQTLQWPDYRGNTMFNTLGNLETDGRAGLLFPDFAGGGLCLSGTARVVWGEGGARQVVFSIACVGVLTEE